MNRNQKMQIARIWLAKPILDDEMKEAAIYALQSERFVLGESVHKFEEEFARYCGTRFAVSTSSGTAALSLSLIALGIGAARDEVITSPLSFVASANSIIHAGAAPKFADVNPQTYTIDPNSVLASLANGRTKAIIPVHLYGFPAAMDELREAAHRHKFALVEDACQAHGASYKGGIVGSIGDVGCFSFYPSKNMTVGGDGGMIVTNDDTIAESVNSLRNCGRVKGSNYIHDKVGFTQRLNTVQAAIGRVQLKRLDKWNEMRQGTAAKYDKLLSDLEEVVTPPRGDKDSKPVYHLYVIRCARRDELRAWLGERGVETGIHYPAPIHLQPIYRKMFGFRGGEFPRSEEVCKDVLSIPMHPNLSPDEIEFVSESIHEFYRKEARRLG
jgi:perosamine synthetase